MHDRSRKKNMHCCWEGGNFSLRNSAEKAGVLGATSRTYAEKKLTFGVFIPYLVTKVFRVTYDQFAIPSESSHNR